MERVKSAQTIMRQALKGEQIPCGAYVDKPMSDESLAHSSRMHDAYLQGRKDAAGRAATLGDTALAREYQNALQAYEDVDPVEPAVSYLVGYAGAINDERINRHNASKDNPWRRRSAA